MGAGDFIQLVATSACRLALRPLPLRLEDESFAPTGFKALETCKNALICPFFGVSKRRSNIQHVVVI